MSAATLAPPAAPALAAPELYRFSVEDFEQMLDMGLFEGKGRIEFIDGQVRQIVVPNPPHENCLDNLNIRITGLVPPGWRVRIQSGITLTTSVALPDLVVARGGDQTFAARRPNLADLGIVAEISDTSLAFDRGDKLRAYAADGIVEYWIVNIPARQIEVYTQPSGPSATPGYAHSHVYLPGTAVPLTLDGVALGAVAVNEIIN